MSPSRLANALVAVAIGGLFLVGLFTHGVLAAALLVVVAAVLIVLSAAAWQHIPSRGRTARVLVVAAVIAIAAAKLAAG